MCFCGVRVILRFVVTNLEKTRCLDYILLIIEGVGILAVIHAILQGDVKGVEQPGCEFIIQIGEFVLLFGNSAKWFWFTVIYQCTFAYVIALLIYQTGSLLQGRGNVVGVTVAALLAAGMIFQLVRPDKNA